MLASRCVSQSADTAPFCFYPWCCNFHKKTLHCFQHTSEAKQSKAKQNLLLTIAMPGLYSSFLRYLVSNVPLQTYASYCAGVKSAESQGMVWGRKRGIESQHASLPWRSSFFCPPTVICPAPLCPEPPTITPWIAPATSLPTGTWCLGAPAAHVRPPAIWVSGSKAQDGCTAFASPLEPWIRLGCWGAVSKKRPQLPLKFLLDSYKFRETNSESNFSILPSPCRKKKLAMWGQEGMQHWVPWRKDGKQMGEIHWCFGCPSGRKVG